MRAVNQRGVNVINAVAVNVAGNRCAGVSRRKKIQRKIFRNGDDGDARRAEGDCARAVKCRVKRRAILRRTQNKPTIARVGGEAQARAVQVNRTAQVAVSGERNVGVDAALREGEVRAAVKLNVIVRRVVNYRAGSSEGVNYGLRRAEVDCRRALRIAFGEDCIVLRDEICVNGRRDACQCVGNVDVGKH